MFTKVKAAAVNVRTKVGAALAISALAVFNVMAQTTDPGVVAINALQAKAEAYVTAGFAIAVFVAGAFWGIAMMKKTFSKAK